MQSYPPIRSNIDVTNTGYQTAEGVFNSAVIGTTGRAWTVQNAAGHNLINFNFDNAAVVPYGAHNAPRAYGAITCVYLGA